METNPTPEISKRTKVLGAIRALMPMALNQETAKIIEKAVKKLIPETSGAANLS